MSTYKYDYKKFGAILKDVLAGKTQREVAKTHKCSFTTISKAKIWNMTGRRVEFKKPVYPEIKYHEKNSGLLYYIANLLEVRYMMDFEQLKKDICSEIMKF